MKSPSGQDPTLIGEPLDRERVNRILDHRENRKPIPWICHVEGLSTPDVRKLLTVAGERHSNGGRELSYEKYEQIKYWVDQDASLMTIMAETGSNFETVKRWFPDAGWEVGGGGKAAEIRQMNKDLNLINFTGVKAQRRHRD